jgi:hypothetical protein
LRAGLAQPNRAAVTGSTPIISSDRRGWITAATMLVLAWAAFAWPWIAGGVTIPWDAKLYYYPAIVDLAAGGSSWTGTMFSGLPAIADPASFHFTPTVRLFAALWGSPGATPSMRAVDVMQLAHLLFAGIGMLLLGRALGLAPAAATIGALVLMLGGPAAGRLQHTMMTISIAWLPWTLLALGGVVRQRSSFGPLRVLLLGLCAAALAVGRDQVAFLCAWAVFAVALGILVHRFASDPREGRRLFVRLAAAGMVTTALLVVPALLTAEFLGRGDRSAITFLDVGHASLQPFALLGLLTPDVFGALTPGSYWGPGRMAWMALSPTGFDWTDETVSHLYLGALVPVLLALGLATGGRPAWPVGAACAITVTAAVYMLGIHTPVFRALHELVPGVALFRRPADATFLFAFGVAALAAFAAQRAFAAAAPFRPNALGLLAVAAIIAAGVAATVWIGRWGGREAAVGAAAAWGVVWILASLAALRLARRRPAIVFLPVALLAVDLVWHGSARPFNAVPVEAVAPYTPGGIALADAIRDAAADGPGPGRAEIFGLGGDWQNAPRVHGIEQTLGYSPLRLAAYDRAVGSRQNAHEARRATTADFTGYGSPLARLLGIRVVATGAPIETILPPDAIVGLRPLGRVGPAWLYRTPAPLPRLMAVGGVVADGARIPDDPTTTVALARVPATLSGLPEFAAAPGTVVIEEWGPGRVDATAIFDRPGVLVVTEIAYPGWIATVNGEPAEILSANRLFMGVPLLPGRHAVALRHSPLSFQALRDRLGR